MTSCVVWLWWGAFSAGVLSEEDVPRLADQVRPLLERSCMRCHGPDRQRGRLRLDSRAAMLRGGFEGPAIVPGSAATSALIERVTTEDEQRQMPQGGERLSPSEVDLLRRWIDAGAPWDGDEGEAPAVSVTHWAYRAPQRPEPPAVQDEGWGRQPIDRFILARLEREGLAPSVEASRETLLRRVTLDLTGLPPTLEEVDAFLEDTRADAYERVVRRLLDSKPYAEHMARQWLDLARYGDTDGFNIDGARSIWPYRDWVIDAFDRDVPFDRFTVEQIAGDMLPNADQATRIATGFHRNTRRNTEGGVDPDEARWESLLDRVETTSAVWLGTTMGCARCHNHKFDPFSQREFFGMLAFFERADEPALDVTPPALKRRRAALEQELRALEEAEPKDGEAIDAQKKRIRQVPRMTTLVLQERRAEGVPTSLFRERGSFSAKGDPVEAGTPDVLHPFRPEWSRDRLGFARWLVDDANPLVARVTVNRLWDRVFGRPLVETVEDFGTQSPDATHPELLDWLATEFVAGGWSHKRFLRMLVTSSTYRQSSAVSAELLERDPFNRWHARAGRRRLEAEEIRDVTLSAAGLLSRRVGGPSVYPLQGDTSGVIPINKTSTRWVPSPGAEKYRRGMYTFWRRTMLFTPFATFDAPSREFCATRRARTNTPLQALVGLNDPGFFDAAQGLGRRVMDEVAGDVAAKVETTFRLCTGRRPSVEERAVLVAAFQKECAYYRAHLDEGRVLVGEQGVTWLGHAVAVRQPDDPDQMTAELAAWTMVANVLLNLDETLCRT